MTDMGDFVFDDTVVRVFPDMINRSVPGYATLVAMIGDLAAELAQPGTRCYDLGCSLGAVGFAMADSLRGRDVEILAVDNSSDMIQALRVRMNERRPGVKLRPLCRDLKTLEIANASLVVLNLTLQFIELDSRLELLRRIRHGLIPGGVLILTEKVVFDDPRRQRRMESLHTAFKRARGYSDLEISQKRAALERVMTPDSVPAHLERLHQAGFAEAQVWFQCFNFASMLAS